MVGEEVDWGGWGYPPANTSRQIRQLEVDLQRLQQKFESPTVFLGSNSTMVVEAENRLLVPFEEVKSVLAAALIQLQLLLPT